MLKIYHNPRCRKSREGLAILEESGEDFEIVKYLDTPPSYMEMAAIVGKLGLDPIEVVRKNEAVWKEKFKGKGLTDKEIIEALSLNPKLIERPIVIRDNKAVIGRPPERIREIL